MGHLTKWLFFNLMFGAIPYALVVALNQLQSPGSPLLHPSSEVLFIAVVATSSALGELWDGEEHSRARPPSPWRGRWQLFLFLSVLLSSLLYGAYVYHSLMSPAKAHGVDCAAVAGLGSRSAGDAFDAAILARWGPACGTWVQVQTRFFLISMWLTGFVAVTSTMAVSLYPARRGGRYHGMV
jgi:hypothetical protein